MYTTSLEWTQSIFNACRGLIAVFSVRQPSGARLWNCWDASAKSSAFIAGLKQSMYEFIFRCWNANRHCPKKKKKKI